MSILFYHSIVVSFCPFNYVLIVLNCFCLVHFPNSIKIIKLSRNLFAGKKL